jgi:fluoroacetyl-CoA thioesterase
MPAEIGLTAEVELVVAASDTAVAHRSGDVAVLATPRIVALCEEAAMAALRGTLKPGETSVGHAVQLDHVAPSGVGARVRAEVTLAKVEGRRLVFTVSVSDARGLVAAGRLTRVVVDAERFLDRAH